MIYDFGFNISTTNLEPSIHKISLMSMTLITTNVSLNVNPFMVKIKSLKGVIDATIVVSD